MVDLVSPDKYENTEQCPIFFGIFGPLRDSGIQKQNKNEPDNPNFISKLLFQKFKNKS